MNTAAPKKRPRGRDRWGLRPVRRGRVRGQIRNVRRGTEVSDFGDMLVFDFDLFVDDDLPLIPVRMSGTDFQGDINEGLVVEMRDPNPQVRPIEPIRLLFPPHYQHEISSYYPGRDDPPPERDRLQSMLVILGPIAFAFALIGIFYAIYG